MLFYRLNQLYNAIFPKIEAGEYDWLNRVLTSKERTVFLHQTLTEQRHAFDVALDIQKQKVALVQLFGKDVYRDLIHAALLHDCGKSLFKLRLWQRIFIVISGYLPCRWQLSIAKKSMLFRKTMIIQKRHPAWGKRLAYKAGVSKEIQQLILNHHAPQNCPETVLFEADNRH